MRATTLPKGLNIGLMGFLCAIVGAIIGFCGAYWDAKWMAVLGYVIVVLGVLLGFVGIAYGWLKEGRRAVLGSKNSAQNTASKFRKNGGKDLGIGPRKNG